MTGFSASKFVTACYQPGQSDQSDRVGVLGNYNVLGFEHWFGKGRGVGGYILSDDARQGVQRYSLGINF
jgi:hypothetical protein